MTDAIRGLKAAALFFSCSFSLTTMQMPVTEQELQKAIAAGVNRKVDDLVSECVAGAGFGEHMSAGMAGGIHYTGGYEVVTSTSIGRVAFLAADAKRLYKPFALADVPEDLRTQGVVVFVNPNKPTSSGKVYQVPAVIDSVVLKSKTDASKVLQPVSFQTEIVEWGNLMGGKVSGNSAIAKFDFEAVRGLPNGDVDVVIITQSGERRCKIGQGDRAKLFR